LQFIADFKVRLWSPDAAPFSAARGRSVERAVETKRDVRKVLLWVVLPLVLAAVVGGCNGRRVETDETAGPDRDAVTPTGTLGGERLVSALRGGGFVIYIRHAATDPVPDDADPVVFSDCDTQRNLSGAGRRQAGAIGQAIDALDIPIGRVLSSPFCRALDTARLAFGTATREQSLENLETAETAGQSDARTRGLRRLLSTPPADGTNGVLVAHGFNITEAADITIGEGEAAVFRPRREGGFELVATVAPHEWAELTE
jgi:phosphohistidine phosphatase SixA